MKKKIIIMIILIFSFNTFLTSCTPTSVVNALISMIPPPERNDFDEEWIIGKSCYEVVAEYGKYHHRSIPWRGEYEIYYIKREKHVGPFGTDPEIYYVIYFDENDIAYATGEELGGKGG